VNDQSDIRLGRHFQVFIEDQLAALDQALIDGEESGPATPLDMEDIKAKARERARASHAA
jgi:Arc/MetJ-type ribon-helix-helix transcriptional regulator